MRMVQMQQLQQQHQQQQAVAAAMYMGATGGFPTHAAAAPSTVACAPAVLSTANMAAMVPPSLLPPIHHHQHQQQAQQQQQMPVAIAGVGAAAAAASAAVTVAPGVVRQASEASSLGIGGGSGDWGIDENAELDSFFVGGSP